MTAIEWLIALVGIGFAIVGWQLNNISSRLSQLRATLQSIDTEVFHLAQEQNPNYGLCDRCGQRSVVRHVVPKSHMGVADTPEMFYCQSCWWMSDSVQVSDENKHYRDRLTASDRLAMGIGPRKS